MDKPTFDLMNFQRQKVHQINGNFRNVFKAKLPSQQQINQQIHRLKNNSIPELENKLRKRKKEFTKTGSMKVKNDIDYMERQLQEYRRWWIYEGVNCRNSKNRNFDFLPGNGPNLPNFSKKSPERGVLGAFLWVFGVIRVVFLKFQYLGHFFTFWAIFSLFGPFFHFLGHFFTFWAFFFTFWAIFFHLLSITAASPRPNEHKPEANWYTASCKKWSSLAAWTSRIDSQTTTNTGTRISTNFKQKRSRLAVPKQIMSKRNHKY